MGPVGETFSQRPERRRAPAPVVGRLLEPLYRAGISRRNAAFDAGRGVKKVEDGRVPVVSIGNLSVGGTGKTPMVMHVLHLLLEHGHRPCVAMRGYSKSRDGAADETDAYRRAFPDVPVVARPDRAAGLAQLFGAGDRERRADATRGVAVLGAREQRADATRSVAVPGGHLPDCVVLDDGFQHRQIARDLDVVLIDATPGRSVFDDRLLPAGWLREPVAGLRRASAVVLTHAELADAAHLAALRGRVRANTEAPVAVTRHVWTGLKRRAKGEDQMLPLETLIGRRVVGCAAIGHPGAFVKSLTVIVRGDRSSPDAIRGGGRDEIH